MTYTVIKMWDNLAIAEFDSNSQFKPEVQSAFEIKTCQRTLFLYFTTPDLIQKFSLSRRNFFGNDAYEFLLRFASGLESEIKGETDVFGQLKTAFKNLSERNPDLANVFRPVILKTFEDTKEIRSNFLHGIGGNTYGALARRLLSPNLNDKILIIGAGEISKSVSPYFAEFNLKVWNRSLNRLTALNDELIKKGHHVQMCNTQEFLIESISQATIILIATPFGSEIDSLVAAHKLKDTKVLHLGAQAREVSTLSFHTLSLSDLFLMEKEQNILRQKQVQQAMDACHERALLRGLSRSIHLAHGWEDLAVFF